MAVSNNPSQGTPKHESTASRAFGEAKDKAQDLADKAKDTASNLMDKARDTASNVADKARDLATHLPERTDDAISAVGQKMTSLADTIREGGPREGVLGTAAGTVADNLRTSGKYLQEHGLEDMGEDMTKVVRRYPFQSLMIAFGVGCLLGMSFSRR
jgi:ElaB/YqjD/DUF883 family membrane-anchored ribosome-binding protein